MSAIVDAMDFALNFWCKDPEKICMKSRLHATSLMAYTVFFMCVVVVMHKFTDGDFSIVLTMSSAVQCLGFVLLALKVHYQRSVSGLSRRTLEMYVMFFIFRLSSTLVKNGYLPIDRSGDHVYQLGDIGSLLLVLYLIYKIRTSDTYQAEFDTLEIWKFVPACVLLALVCHGDLNNSPFFDTVWTISLFLDTISMLPQLWMLTKLGGQVEALTSHYVASLTVSRLLSFAFWLYGYKELVPLKGGPNIAGYTILISHTLQLLLCADFMYYYAKGMSKASRQMTLPTFEV